MLGKNCADNADKNKSRHTHGADSQQNGLVKSAFVLRETQKRWTAYCYPIHERAVAQLKKNIARRFDVKVVLFGPWKASFSSRKNQLEECVCKENLWQYAREEVSGLSRGRMQDTFVL